ncbi:MAG: hypothetical protein PHH65_09075, partial [Eubacteriales bacterium]|nr:hypothetical protein [Eubacteriales bacterium]
RTMARSRFSVTEMEKGLARQARSGEGTEQAGFQNAGQQSGQGKGQNDQEGSGGGGSSGGGGNGKGK